MNIGDTIKAEVTDIRPFGVFLKHHEDKILVLITEIREEPIEDLFDLFEVGSIETVQLLRFNSESGVWAGTLKHDDLPGKSKADTGHVDYEAVP